VSKSGGNGRERETSEKNGKNRFGKALENPRREMGTGEAYDAM
jgi:hypothetical protein